METLAVWKCSRPSWGCPTRSKSWCLSSLACVFLLNSYFGQACWALSNVGTSFCSRFKQSSLFVCLSKLNHVVTCRDDHKFLYMVIGLFLLNCCTNMSQQIPHVTRQLFIKVCFPPDWCINSITSAVRTCPSESSSVTTARDSSLRAKLWT